MITRTAIPALAACLALTPAAQAFAQPGTQDESTAPDHNRHLLKHNPPMPSAHDHDRFSTSRTSPIELPLPGEDDAFFFVVYGDRTGGPDSGINVLKDAVRDTNLLEPDLVFTVGDMIQGYNESPQWYEQMHEFKSVMGELAMPWFPVAGNHDVYWRNKNGGETRPEGEHDAKYEINFGPLWYAFEHKDCMFIALYTDEGNPSTGEKTFRKPESQRMSPEQFAWLKETLADAKDMEHVFVFLHHPRWLGNNYGDDWNKVHAELVRAGNVSAVFAGHIHHMRYDPKDGIEYVTLATVGAHNNKAVPQAGWLHHFNVVTVRDGRLALSALPVGEVMDVREITGEFAEEMGELASQRPEISRPLNLDSSGATDQTIGVPVVNTSSHDTEFTIVPGSADSRWRVTPDHMHFELAPGESVEAEFRVMRDPSTLDDTLRPITLAIDAEALLPGHRYAIPTIGAEPDLDFELESLPDAIRDRALAVTGQGYAEVPAKLAAIPEGPFTIETWFRATDYTWRTGLLTKTESSEYGLFVSDAIPQFSVHLGGEYVVAKADTPTLSTGVWHHAAGVYDGTEVRLYIDGSLVATTPATGARKPNDLPLMIGADVTGSGQATSYFRGDIDNVRLSTIARYSGESFTPEASLDADSDTTLLFDMDRAVGPWIINEASGGGRARMRNQASLVAHDSP